MNVEGKSRSGYIQELQARPKAHALAQVGPGLITGVADDDPSGIATYSQAGAQFGLGMLWTMPLAFPLMAAVQSMCGSLGRVTGKGLAANIKIAFSPAVLYGVVALLLIANTLNIAADVAAMGEAAELVMGVDRHSMTVLFVFVTLLLQVFVPYHRYVFVLKWLTLSLLAYAAVLFTVHVPWGQVALRTVWPRQKIREIACQRAQSAGRPRSGIDVRDACRMQRHGRCEDDEPGRARRSCPRRESRSRLSPV